VIVSVDGADAVERGIGTRVIDPATVRPRLAEAAAEGLDGIRKTLLDAATGAVRDHWITFECGECGSRKGVEVPVPDVRARVAAIELLLREGLGRAPQAEETPAPRLPANAAAVAQMDWQELQMLATTLCVDEIASVVDGTGKALLRDRLAPHLVAGVGDRVAALMLRPVRGRDRSGLIFLCRDPRSTDVQHAPARGQSLRSCK
jgi:hypothetical protein